MSMAASGSVQATTKMSPALHSGERLAGPQHRQRAFQAAQIEGLFRHLKGSRGSQKSWSILIIGRLFWLSQT